MASGVHISSRPGRAKFRTDLEKHVIVSNLENRGYTRVKEDDEEAWNFFWASVSTIRQMFSPDSGIRLTENQFVNHFPNFYELCRKDLMVKNIKRYRKDLERDGNALAERDEHGKYRLLDIVPQTYLLPGDFNLFVDEFKRVPGSVWILKPNARSQGSGIVIVSKLAQIKKWAQKVMSTCTVRTFIGRSIIAQRHFETIINWASCDMWSIALNDSVVFNQFVDRFVRAPGVTRTSRRATLRIRC